MRVAIAIAIALVLGSAATPAHADYQSGVLAYEAGRYDDALAEFLSLTEAGDAAAEFMVGVMYFYGRGVERNDSSAAVWFYKSARKGNANAQLAFGSLHIRGTGVRRDLVEAYMWLTLAAESGVAGLRRQAIILRDDASRLMSREEIERGRAMAEDFEPARAGIASSE
jgi:TPR repeat protein